MKRLVIATFAAFVCAAFVNAETIKLKCDGVKCDACASAISDAVGKVAGVKVKTDPSKQTPVVTIDADLKKTDIGAIGKAVAGAETPHKEVEAPGAYLVVDAPKLTAANAKDLEKSLKGVKGVNATLSSADVKAKQLLIKINDSGEAKLAEVTKALAAYTK
ncbi:MAG: hypothetical protein K2R98_18695 [Gemmataceae bacterium]|nr:hypothetical protein [Gemmataceae bacterium]